jgi:prepilin-type processing-associated H-X9-DG protein
VREAEVVSPADMIAIADSVPMPAQPNVIYTFLLSINTAPRPERHNPGSNVLFADGHVIAIPDPQLMNDNEANRRRWNRDHEPHYGEVPSW